MAHAGCKHLLSSLSEYVDGTLSEELCTEIERHMGDCHNCQIVVNTLRKTIELYHETAPMPETPEEVRLRLFRRLELDAFIKDE